MRQVAQFGDLAAANECSRVNFLEVLEKLPRHLGACALSQRTKLLERVLGRNPTDIANRDPNQDGAFTVGCGYLIGRQGYSLALGCRNCIRLRPPVEPLTLRPRERRF